MEPQALAGGAQRTTVETGKALHGWIGLEPRRAPLTFDEIGRFKLLVGDWRRGRFQDARWRLAELANETLRQNQGWVHQLGRGALEPGCAPLTPEETGLFLRLMQNWSLGRFQEAR